MIFFNPLVPMALDLGSDDPGVRLQAVQQLVRRLPAPGFLETLRQQQLTPLIYHNLSQFSREEVGEVPLLEELRREYFWHLRRCKIQERETRLLVEVLAEAGVEVILLKGADIRHRLYDDPACRPMNDLDVLISPLDLEKAQTALKRRGYTRASFTLDLRPGFLAQFGWVISYRSPMGSTLVVDVHWEIQEVGTLYRLPYESLRKRALAQDLGSLPVLVLGAEHLAMHLLLHTIDELESGPLLKLVDLERVLQRLSLDWDFFSEEVNRFRLQEPVLWMFQKLARWRPGLVPSTVWKNLHAKRPGCVEGYILRRQSGAMLIAMALALCRHLPVRAWPAYLEAKLWPTRSYLESNPRLFSTRLDYLRHLLGLVKRLDGVPSDVMEMSTQ
jgi:hypothetical protein